MAAAPTSRGQRLTERWVKADRATIHVQFTDHGYLVSDGSTERKVEEGEESAAASAAATPGRHMTMEQGEALAMRHLREGMPSHAEALRAKMQTFLDAERAKCVTEGSGKLDVEQAAGVHGFLYCVVPTLQELMSKQGQQLQFSCRSPTMAHMLVDSRVWTAVRASSLTRSVVIVFNLMLHPRHTERAKTGEYLHPARFGIHFLDPPPTLCANPSCTAAPGALAVPCSVRGCRRWRYCTARHRAEHVQAAKQFGRDRMSVSGVGANMMQSQRASWQPARSDDGGDELEG